MFLNILRISPSNVLKRFLNMIVSIGRTFVIYPPHQPSGIIICLYIDRQESNNKQKRFKTKLYIHNAGADVALTSTNRETKYFHDLVQYPKQKFFAFPQPLPKALEKKVLIKKVCCVCVWLNAVLDWFNHKSEWKQSVDRRSNNQSTATWYLHLFLGKCTFFLLCLSSSFVICQSKENYNLKIVLMPFSCEHLSIVSSLMVQKGFIWNHKQQYNPKIENCMKTLSHVVCWPALYMWSAVPPVF